MINQKKSWVNPTLCVDTHGGAQEDDNFFELKWFLS